MKLNCLLLGKAGKNMITDVLVLGAVFGYTTEMHFDSDFSDSRLS